MATIIAAMYFIIISYESNKIMIDGWMLYTLSIMMVSTLFVAYSAMLEFLIKNWNVYLKILKK